MTKDQFESKFEDAFDSATSRTEGGYGADFTSKRDALKALYPAVEEFAKEQAIAFLEYKQEQGYILEHARNEYMRFGAAYINEPRLSAEELYAKFITSQSANNKEVV